MPVENLLSRLMWSALIENGGADTFGLTAADASKRVQAMLGGRLCARRFGLRLASATATQTYFLRMEVPGRRRLSPVKIGTSTHPVARAQSIQVGSPFVVTLLGVIPEILLPEFSLHERFGAHRLRGEWFSPRGELRLLLHDVEHFTVRQQRFHAKRCGCGWLYNLQPDCNPNEKAPHVATLNAEESQC